MTILKYILWGLGAFAILVAGDKGNAGLMILGIILLIAPFFTKIKNTIDDFSSSKSQDELLKLKSLLDQGILTQEEYNQKSKKLKEKI